MKYILNISIYLSLHAMISMWSVFYTYTAGFVWLQQQHGGRRLFTIGFPSSSSSTNNNGSRCSLRTSSRPMGGRRAILQSNNSSGSYRAILMHSSQSWFVSSSQTGHGGLPAAPWVSTISLRILRISG